MPKCPDCDGIGYETLTDEILCAACDGSGAVLGARCIDCCGRGSIETSSNVVCECCHGKGEVSPTREAECRQE